MIEQQITLCSNGRAVLSGYSGGLLLGYAHNTGVYRLRVVCSGEWDGTTVAAFWHLPGPAGPLTTLVADGAVEVPALVTAQGGSGTVTFEGSDGTRTVTSASVPYRVLSNSGTTDPTLPEPGTPAWQQFLQQVKRELRNAASGLSDEERGLILALFRHAVYDNGEMLPHYNALAALWSGSSLPDVPPTPSQPDPPSQPDTPSSGLPTPRYKLAAPKTFVPANKEWIDTGIKPFATIDTGMDLTVYATFTVADSAVNTVTSLLDCFSNLTTNDQRGIVVATWTNGTVGVNVFTYGSHFVKIESGKKLKFLLQIKGTQFRFLSYGSLTEWKNIPNYAANKTVDHPLILGAGWGDGTTKDRFFNGTVYDFRVFDTALTDAQITTLMEAN
ncbi:MAG TPA: LamG domain-containing protein [Faecalibacterium prausnitzii]|nr:LamG domain-containing protein [Faecalibacterium prausnitzii]